MVTLPESDDFDCVTCTCIADVDWDGSNEILLGTYGQVSLVVHVDIYFNLKHMVKLRSYCEIFRFFSLLLFIGLP